MPARARVLVLVGLPMGMAALVGVFVFDPLMGRLRHAYGREHLSLLNDSDSLAVVEIDGLRLTVAPHDSEGLPLRTGRTYAATVRFEDGVTDSWSVDLPRSESSHLHAAALRPGTCIGLVDVSRLYGLSPAFSVVMVTRDRLVTDVDFQHVMVGSLPARIERDSAARRDAYWLTPIPCDVGPGASGDRWLRETFEDVATGGPATSPHGL
jgi:hypothetical protein